MFEDSDIVISARILLWEESGGAFSGNSQPVA